MEVIRKKICIEKARSRQQGLLPYIPYNKDITTEYSEVTEDDVNGNYGNFVMNFKEIGSNKQYTNYIELLANYRRIINALLNGIHLKRVRKDGQIKWAEYPNDDIDLYSYKAVNINEFNQISEHLYEYSGEEDLSSYMHLNMITDYEIFELIEDDDYSYCKFVDGLLAKLYIPKSIKGSKVPEWIDYSDIKPWIEWLESHKNARCCEYKLFLDKGGEEMLDFLKEHEGDYQEAIDDIMAKYEFETPTLSIPLLLTRDMASIGVLESYIDEDTLPYTGNESSYETGITTYISESKLETLKTGKQIYDDNGTLVPGVFITPEEPTFYGYRNGEWVDLETPGYEGDYEVVLFKNAIPEDAPIEKIFKVLYINSEENPTQIPYKVNVPKNTFCLDSGDTATFIGDFILDITQTGNQITFTYVIGGEYIAIKDTKEVGSSKVVGYVFDHYVEGTGVQYQETGELVTTEEYFVIDGIESVPIYIQSVSFEKSEANIYSEEYDASRTAIEANIIAMPNMYEYDEDKELLIQAPVFKPDYFLGVTKEITAKVDVVVSRGNAAAFERHFELTECNTLEDLENYKNNTFGI